MGGGRGSMQRVLAAAWQLALQRQPASAAPRNGKRKDGIHSFGGSGGGGRRWRSSAQRHGAALPAWYTKLWQPRGESRCRGAPALTISKLGAAPSPGGLALALATAIKK